MPSPFALTVGMEVRIPRALVSIPRVGISNPRESELNPDPFAKPGTGRGRVSRARYTAPVTVVCIPGPPSYSTCGYEGWRQNTANLEQRGARKTGPGRRGRRAWREQNPHPTTTTAMARPKRTIPCLMRPSRNRPFWRETARIRAFPR